MRIQLDRDLLVKCWLVAKQRDAIKHPSTDQRVANRPGYEIHFDGLRAEVAIAQFFGQPELVDFSVQLTGDGGSDLSLLGLDIQVKATTYDNPPLLRFNITGSQAFRAEVAALAYVPRVSRKPDSQWCERCGYVDLVGWVDRDAFLQRAEVFNFGHGPRLVLGPPLFEMSQLLTWWMHL